LGRIAYIPIQAPCSGYCAAPNEWHDFELRGQKYDLPELTMKTDQKRLDRERHTIQVMIAAYCVKHHPSGLPLCSDCQDLLTYAMQRIDKCPYQLEKPPCAKCPIH
jgi:hypothetical protein